MLKVSVVQLAAVYPELSIKWGYLVFMSQSREWGQNNSYFYQWTIVEQSLHTYTSWRFKKTKLKQCSASQTKSVFIQAWFWKYEITKPQMSRCHIIVSGVSQCRGGAILSTVFTVSTVSMYLGIYSVQYLELRWGEKSSRILLSGLSVFVSHRRSPEEATDAGMVQGCWKYSEM